MESNHLLRFSRSALPPLSYLVTLYLSYSKKQVHKYGHILRCFFLIRCLKSDSVFNFYKLSISSSPSKTVWHKTVFYIKKSSNYLTIVTAFFYFSSFLNLNLYALAIPYKISLRPHEFVFPYKLFSSNNIILIVL